MTRCLLFFATLYLLPGNGLAQGPAAQAPVGAHYRIRTIQGNEVTAKISKIEPDWSLRLAGVRPAFIAGNEIISLRQAGVLLPPPPARRHVILSNRDRIPVAVGSRVHIARERLNFQPRSPLAIKPESEMKVPLPFVEVLFLQQPQKNLAPERTVNRLLDESRPRDVVVMTNGDRIVGTVTAFDTENTCSLKSAGKTIRIPVGQITAVAFSTRLLVRPRPSKKHAAAVFSNGARLMLESAQLHADGKTISGETFYRIVIEAPLIDLLGLDMRQDNIVFLSDLEPAKYQHVSFFGLSWPLGRDREVGGLGLHLRGVGAIDKGLGMHAGTTVTFKLNGNFRWFESLGGVDARTGNTGSGRVAILVDGKTAFQSGEMTANDPPRRIRIAIKNANTLTLAVTGGAGGNVQARFTLAGARLIK